MKKYISISTKITLFASLLLLLAALMISLVIYNITSDFFEKESYRSLDNEATLVANDIENTIINLVDNLKVLSKTPPIKGIVRSLENQGMDVLEQSTTGLWKNRLQRIFAAMIKVNPSYTQLRYIGLADNGKELVRVDRVNDEVIIVPENALQEKGKESYFKEASKASIGSIFFSEISYNRENGKVILPLVPTLRVILSINNFQHQMFGFLVVNVNIVRYLRQSLQRTGVRQDIFLFNNEGDLFYYNARTQELHFYNPKGDSDNLPTHLSWINIHNISQSLSDNPDYVTVLKDIYADKHKSQKLFKLALAIPTNKFLKNDMIFLRTALSWVLLIGVLSAIVILIFTKGLTRKLTDMAFKIEKNYRSSDLIDSLPTHRNDEVGVLARAFERHTKLLKKLALYDSLTGLPNRKNFVDHLNEAILRAKRSGHFIGIFFFDINHFKDVNDSYGHDYGDDLLIKFAALLKKSTRDADFCARLSGDEFAVFCESIQDKNRLIEIADRYEDTLNTSYDVKGVTMQITISGGVCMYPDNGKNSTDLLQSSDKAMYQSKSKRDGKIYFFENES